MRNTDPRVDAYIEKAPEYSRPILTKLRRLFHKADPGIEETIKWGNPTFMHKGIVGGMGAFKKHVAFGFWNPGAMRDPEGIFAGDAKQSPYAIKIASTKELPADRVLLAYIKEAVELNEKGVKGSPGSRKKKPRPAPRVPTDLKRALDKSKKAQETFRSFPPSHKREYIEWITEAKRDATRAKRIATAIEWMAAGKPRNWKYMQR